jgi:hypothetical protein
MRATLGTLVLGLFLVGGPALQGQPKQPKKPGPVTRLMAKKLTSAKDVLEGIALADFKKIRLSAEELLKLTRTEEWHVVKTARYELFSNEFRRAAEAIIQKAKARNIDGVTLSYFEMTMSCVRCHEHVREVREARRPGPPEQTTRLAQAP